MTQQTQAVAKEDKPEKIMEYVPFGGKDAIKLSVAIVKNLIAVRTKSGHTCSDGDAMKFLMMCKARLLNPFEGDAFLIGYDGREGPTFSLITAHQAFLKRAEVNAQYDGMKSGIIVEEDGKLSDLEGDFYTKKQTPVGGWATVYFKNRSQPMHRRIRMERFKKSFGIWQDDAAGMICKCAEADALRSSFPTMLGGLYLKEEMQQEPPAAAKPIFGSVTTDDKATVSVPQVAETMQDKIHFIKVNAEVKGLTELDICEYLISISAIPEGCTTLDEAAFNCPTIIESVRANQEQIINNVFEYQKTKNGN